MGNDQDIRTLVQQWHRSNPANRTFAHRENKLFQMLYEAYCRRSGDQIRWAQLSTYADYEDACTRLYGWYRQTYELGFQMPAGKKGQKRAAGPSGQDYSFHLRYSDSRSFELYLLKGLHLSGSQTLLSFVLHTAVAFLVPPDQLDAVLQYLGFHPLHVKNIHHLAIYYVLLTAEPGSPVNPFDMVRELYLRAHELLSKSPEAPQDGYLYADQLTRAIREELFLRKAIGRENFEKLVLLNRDSLNMRHSMILRDFHRLTAIFFHVFDDPHFCPEDPLQADAGEDNYSFYAFVGRYCREYLTRKKYRDWLCGMIDREGKHPTRDVMILLWLYAYCFAFLPGIFMEPVTVNRIKKKLQKADPDQAASIGSFYQNDTLDIYGLIMGAKKRSVPGQFRGADFVTYINEKLLSYGWGPLNEKLAFDHYIMQLDKLVMRMDPSQDHGRCRSIRYGDGELTGIPTMADNVPCPLAAITWILHHLKAVHLSDPNSAPCPLECSLYEQV